MPLIIHLVQVLLVICEKSVKCKKPYTLLNLNSLATQTQTMLDAQIHLRVYFYPGIWICLLELKVTIYSDNIILQGQICCKLPCNKRGNVASKIT